MISATVSVYKLTILGLLAGADVMVSRYGKKQWVVPVLEKIEMANTQQIAPGCSETPSKQKPGVETPGTCGNAS